MIKNTSVGLPIKPREPALAKEKLFKKSPDVLSRPRIHFAGTSFATVRTFENWTASWDRNIWFFREVIVKWRQLRCFFLGRSCEIMKAKQDRTVVPAKFESACFETPHNSNKARKKFSVSAVQNNLHNLQNANLKESVGDNRSEWSEDYCTDRSFLSPTWNGSFHHWAPTGINLSGSHLGVHLILHLTFQGFWRLSWEKVVRVRFDCFIQRPGKAMRPLGEPKAFLSPLFFSGMSGDFLVKLTAKNLRRWIHDKLTTLSFRQESRKPTLEQLNTGLNETRKLELGSLPRIDTPRFSTVVPA